MVVIFPLEKTPGQDFDTISKSKLELALRNIRATVAAFPPFVSSCLDPSRRRAAAPFRESLSVNRLRFTAC
jgi:hypothetical protein